MMHLQSKVPGTPYLEFCGFAYSEQKAATTSSFKGAPESVIHDDDAEIPSPPVFVPPNGFISPLSSMPNSGKILSIMESVSIVCSVTNTSKRLIVSALAGQASAPQ
mmetsp:Transcript_16052/g.26818  ORF Transcript_16052/g.26818 Transcript_16052/m.26818 type:complete len:106 (-) Transcript_16052:977-1294(-)